MFQISRNTQALIFGSIASILWSSVFVAGRYLCDNMGMHPILVAFFRFSIAGIVSILYIVLKGEIKTLKLLLEKPLNIIFLALTGIFGMGSSVFLALKYSTAIDVSIIMNSNAIFVTPLAFLVGEKITFRKVIGIAIGVLGCALVINGDLTSVGLIRKEYLKGNFLAILAALFWAIYTVSGKGLVRKHGGLVVTSLNMIVGSIPSFFIVVGLGELVFPSSKAFLILIYLAIFPTAIGFIFWYKALEQIDASQLAPLQYLVPVGTAIISIFALGESLKLASVIGMLLVFLGIYLSTMSKRSFN
jgi:drug/metabolite transporter (DMT)-like permease